MGAPFLCLKMRCLTWQEGCAGKLFLGSYFSSSQKNLIIIDR